MNKIDWTLIIALITNIIALIGAVWKLSQWESSLKVKIEKNRNDINQGLISVREDAHRSNNLLQMQIDTMAEFLKDTTDYRHPSIGQFIDATHKRRQ